MAMAVAGMGCRAPSAMLVRPASVMRLLPTCSAMNPCGTRQISSSAVQNSWRAGSRLGFLGLGEERNRKAVSRSSPPRRFFVKAIDVSGPGSVDSPLMQSMQAKIKEGLNAERVSVKDAYGDGRHVSIEVVASVFEGKSAVNRQRLVYKAIWEELQEKVHAVDQLKTRTPSEAANAPGRL